MDNPSPFLRLPLELRELIYSAYLTPDRSEPDDYFGGGKYKFRFELFRACKSIYYESLTVWRREYVFVRIETPWPQAVHHMSAEGLVPVVAIGPPAAPFPHHHSLITISAPTHHHFADADNSIVLLLQDLPLFCQVWYYSSLSHADLNSQLATTFHLRDPYFSADPKPIPLAIQQKILFPFGVVRGLYSVEFDGPWDDGVRAELEARMREKHPNTQQCCEKAASLMEEGDALLAQAPARNAEAALNLYNKAFFAIHIVVDGRSRRVMADGFFNDTIPAGRYKGQSAATIRIVLRIALVARVILAYLHAQQPLEAAYWGMRTVRIMRQALDVEFDEFLGGFAGTGDEGLIHARTAIAVAMLERAGHARWRVEVDCDGVDEANEGRLWELATRFLGKGRMEEQKKRALDEAKIFGVSAPPGVFIKSEGWLLDEMSVADSMGHMDFAEMDE